MNYRHRFHAGNFADVVKHAILLRLIARLTADPRPLRVLDTHAGAGAYDLGGEAALRSGEAAAGVARLMADPAAPPAFDGLKAAVAAVNAGGASGEVRRYPGSPLLALAALRPGDRWVGCELRPDDEHALAQALRAATLRTAARPGGAPAEARLADGFEAAAEPPLAGARTLLVIDPPYERGDDYARTVQALQRARAEHARRRADLTALVWAPLKDLTTLDALVTGLEGLGFPAGFTAQVRLRPLGDPLRLNGCAVVLLGGAPDLEAVREDAGTICGWAAARLGEAGAREVVEPLG